MHGAKSGRNEAQVSKNPFPVGSHTTCLLPPTARYVQMCKVSSTREARLETRYPGLLLGACYAGTLCPVCTKILGSQKGEQVFRISRIVYTKSLGTVSHCYQLNEVLCHWEQFAKVQHCKQTL